MGASEDSRLEQICSEFVVKSVHIITTSRTPSPVQEAGRQFGARRDTGKATQSPKWFNLDLGDLEVSLRRQLEAWSRGDTRSPLFLLVYQHNTARQSKPLLLERWTIAVSPSQTPQGPEAPSASVIRGAYKRAIILLRSLFCRIRLLPVHNIVRTLSLHMTSSTFENLSSSSLPFLKCEILRDPGEKSNFPIPHEMIERVAFTPVVTPLGDLCVSVEYVNERGIQHLQTSFSSSENLGNKSVYSQETASSFDRSTSDHRANCVGQSLSAGLDMRDNHLRANAIECTQGGPDIADNACSTFSVSLYPKGNAPEFIPDYISPYRSGIKDQKTTNETLHLQSSPNGFEGMVRRNSWGTANPLRFSPPAAAVAAAAWSATSTRSGNVSDHTKCGSSVSSFQTINRNGLSAVPVKIPQQQTPSTNTTKSSCATFGSTPPFAITPHSPQSASSNSSFVERMIVDSRNANPSKISSQPPMAPSSAQGPLSISPVCYADFAGQLPSSGSDAMLHRSPVAGIAVSADQQSSLDSMKGSEGAGSLKTVRTSTLAKLRADGHFQSAGSTSIDDDDMMDAAFAIDDDMDDNSNGKRQIDGVSRLVAALYSAPESLQDKEALQVLQQQVDCRDHASADQRMVSSTYHEADVHSVGGALERLRVLTEMQTMLVS